LSWGKGVEKGINILHKGRKTIHVQRRRLKGEIQNGGRLVNEKGREKARMKKAQEGWAKRFDCCEKGDLMDGKSKGKKSIRESGSPGRLHVKSGSGEVTPPDRATGKQRKGRLSEFHYRRGERGERP